MNGIILLAAGASQRFGSPKQLADLNGRPLLRHAAETALEAAIGPVQVVLGAVDAPCREVLSGLDVGIVLNTGWRQGMASSIAAGLRPWLTERLDGVIIFLADQPAVTSDHLRTLALAGGSHEIVASRYVGQLGVPAWFSSARFPDLMDLEGEKGAKSLIAREPDAAWIDLPAAALDIDTPSDLHHASSGFGPSIQVPVRKTSRRSSARAIPAHVASGPRHAAASP